MENFREYRVKEVLNYFKKIIENGNNEIKKKVYQMLFISVFRKAYRVIFRQYPRDLRTLQDFTELLASQPNALLPVSASLDFWLIKTTLDARKISC